MSVLFKLMIQSQEKEKCAQLKIPPIEWDDFLSFTLLLGEVNGMLAYLNNKYLTLNMVIVRAVCRSVHTEDPL